VICDYYATKITTVHFRMTQFSRINTAYWAQNSPRQIKRGIDAINIVAEKFYTSLPYIYLSITEAKIHSTVEDLPKLCRKKYQF